MSATLLHFGCGALGLGLVVNEFFNSDNDIDIIIANRNSSDSDASERNIILKEKLHYYRRDYGNDYRIKFSEFIYFDEVERLVEIVASDNIVYFTTSLKEAGVVGAVELISMLLYKRQSLNLKYPLVFIACENAISSTKIQKLLEEHLSKTNNLSYKFNNSIIFVDCVVDRLCNQPQVDSKRNVIVRAEDYWLWILADKQFKKIKDSSVRSEIITTLSKLKGVQLEQDLDFFVRRKKWLVNSLHQVISLCAHDLNWRIVSDFLDTETGFQILDRVASEITEIYLKNELNTQRIEAIKYINRVKERLLEFPSNCETALTRFKNPNSLTDFFRDYNRKIGEPMISFMEKTGKSPYYLSLILLKTTLMISQGKYVFAEE